jgi:ATP-binding cassette subfamily B protein
VAFNSYLMIGMAPLMLLGNMLTMVSRADASAARVWEVLDTEPIVKTAPKPHQSDELVGAVQFTDVTFAYMGREEEPDSAEPVLSAAEAINRNVLTDISFDIPPGQKIALLGATGSGKSTLISLIPRFYDADSGHVKVDGIDVRQWDLDSLRKQIGVVLQQTTLFSGTICENIAYGRPNATLDEVTTAAKAAQAHDFISAMPDGYDSFVEERGANLSGGQKQRIALARALLVQPAILIMDDSTSAVDLETEARIKHALDGLMAGKTTFIVAQRIQSVLNADQIIILDQGRIRAQGTHTELLTSSPIYREIYQSQMGYGARMAEAR